MNMCQHAEQILQYAEDVKTYFEPWKLWQFRKKGSDAKWQDVEAHPQWTYYNEYQRKPEMLKVTLGDGTVVEWPKPISEFPEAGSMLFYVDGNGFINRTTMNHNGDFDEFDKRLLESGKLHRSREAAKMHLAAIIAINTQGD